MSAEAVNWQALFDVVLALALFLLGGLAKVLWGTVEQLRGDMLKLSQSVNHIEEKLPETYLRRDDFKDHANRVLDTLERIESKLNAKVDK